MIVFSRWRWKGSPNSYSLVSSERSTPRPASSMRCLPDCSFLSWAYIAQGLLADFLGTSRRQLPGIAALADVARLLEDLEELA